MASFADLFNVGSEFEFEGTTYAARKPDQLEQGRYQKWLEDSIVTAILRDTVTSEDAKDRALSRHYRDCGLGDYEWGSPACLQSFMNWKGFAKFYEILYGVDAETAKRMVESPIQQAIAAMGRVAAENPKLFREVFEQHLESRGLPTEWLNGILSLLSSTLPSEAPATSPSSPDSATNNSGVGGEKSSEPTKDTPNSAGPTSCPPVPESSSSITCE